MKPGGQRAKGASFERDIASRLRQIFGSRHEIKRGLAQTRYGASEAPDVDGVPRIWVETKHQQLVNLRAALAQARDAEAEFVDKLKQIGATIGRRWPAAVCKDNHARPLVIMYFDDWSALLREWWYRCEPSDTPRDEPPVIVHSDEREDRRPKTPAQRLAGAAGDLLKVAQMVLDTATIETPPALIKAAEAAVTKANGVVVKKRKSDCPECPRDGKTWCSRSCHIIYGKSALVDQAKRVRKTSTE